MAGTVELHRVIKAPVSRVFKAFSDPAAKAAWLPPFGFTATVHAMDFKVGGTYRMSFTNFSTGNSHSFGGKFLEIKPDALIRFTDIFENPGLPGCYRSIPFGQDNHTDSNLALETQQHISGVASIKALMSQLAAARQTKSPPVGVSAAPPLTILLCTQRNIGP